MITLLESIQALTFLIIIYTSMFYRRQLKLTRWKRKLSIGEMMMYVLLTISLPLFMVTYFILLLET
jgi:hypothetical protein